MGRLFSASFFFYYASVQKKTPRRRKKCSTVTACLWFQVGTFLRRVRRLRGNIWESFAAVPPAPLPSRSLGASSAPRPRRSASSDEVGTSGTSGTSAGSSSGSRAKGGNSSSANFKFQLTRNKSFSLRHGRIHSLILPPRRLAQLSVTSPGCRRGGPCVAPSLFTFPPQNMSLPPAAESQTRLEKTIALLFPTTVTKWWMNHLQLGELTNQRLLTGTVANGRRRHGPRGVAGCQSAADGRACAANGGAYAVSCPKVYSSQWERWEP